MTALLTLEAAGRKRPAAAFPTKTRTHNRTEGLKTRKLGVLKRPSKHEAAAPAVDSANLIASMAPTTPPAQAQFALSVHGSDSEPELIQVACSDTEMESSIDLPDWLQEDGVVAVDTHLLQSLADEVASLAATAAYQKVSKGFACPCCPWRSFQSPSRVTDHLRRYHVKRNQYCCSGKKQIKCVLSLHDSDMIQGHQAGKYLQRSAQLLKEQVRPPFRILSMRSTEGYGYFLIQKAGSGVDMKGRVDIVSHLRCGFITVWLGLQVFTACVPRVRETERPANCHACLYPGPRFIREDALGNTVFARRVGNIFYTHAFAEMIGQSMLTCSLMLFFAFAAMFPCLVLSGNDSKTNNISELSLCRPRVFGHN